ncbi:OLC1v1030576C1 [Oldenlandia corymbosa var. corymbosa]|nr:OLC1v1030576C1 [Oldenlandia corymbosa var. corymbosa]
MQAHFIIDLGAKARVPIISFSATSPSLSSIRSPYFIRSTVNDSSQVQVLSSIVSTFGWREVVLIYVDNEFGEGIIPFLMDALDALNIRVPYRSVIRPMAREDEISAELYKLMTMQTRVFIVHMLPDLASKLFIKAKHLGMMSDEYAWIATDAIMNALNTIDHDVLDLMQGVIGVRPYIPKSQELTSFMNRWKKNYRQNNPSALNAQLSLFGLWAYDSATALAIAVEKSGNFSTNGFWDQDFLRNSSSTDLESLGISKNGAMLLKALLETSFTGITGYFKLDGGQLQSPAYQIVNVIANGAKEVAFWTSEKGIEKDLNSTANKISNTDKAISKSDLTIIWPGDKASPPKGWVIPTSGKKLRVGVPVKDGFFEFVNVERNSDNSSTVTGYSIDIFKAVMSSLPYAVPYEFIPWENSDGKIVGNYNELIYQVYLGVFDAIAGDTTIVANRSQYVDFTMPYTESGVSMIVPIRQNQQKNAWVFLKPLTWDLWLTTFFFFVIIGFLIWLLEHRINDEFRGPPLHQIGMVFWFSFSTMVFAQKEKVVSNSARFVLIIWFWVVVILIQSYTASLTSMLTVQQLQPTVTNVNELLKNKAYVGYQKGSFVTAMLVRMGFEKFRLVEYNSVDELHKLFTIESGNGGIAAAFDEIPYMKLFLATYCNQYTTVQPTYKTDGFAFVFPIGSPLVGDVSRAILTVTEGDQMTQIEKAWILEKSTCQDSSESLASSSLDLGSFWGLFLIVGIAVALAFVIHVAMFLLEHWRLVTDTGHSTWEKIVMLARRFDDKDLSSHTFRKSEIRGGGTINGDETNEIPPRSPSYPQSPSEFPLQGSPFSQIPRSPTLSSHTQRDFSGEQEYHPNDNVTSMNQEGDLSSEIVPAIELISPNSDQQMT